MVMDSDDREFIAAVAQAVLRGWPDHVASEDDIVTIVQWAHDTRIAYELLRGFLSGEYDAIAVRDGEPVWRLAQAVSNG